jgi:hypothetical protein
LYAGKGSVLTGIDVSVKTVPSISPVIQVDRKIIGAVIIGVFQSVYKVDVAVEIMTDGKAGMYSFIHFHIVCEVGIIIKQPISINKFRNRLTISTDFIAAGNGACRIGYGPTESDIPAFQDLEITPPEIDLIIKPLNQLTVTDIDTQGIGIVNQGLDLLQTRIDRCTIVTDIEIALLFGLVCKREGRQKVGEGNGP